MQYLCLSLQHSQAHFLKVLQSLERTFVRIILVKLELLHGHARVSIIRNEGYRGRYLSH